MVNNPYQRLAVRFGLNVIKEIELGNSRQREVIQHNVCFGIGIVAYPSPDKRSLEAYIMSLESRLGDLSVSETTFRSKFLREKKVRF